MFAKLLSGLCTVLLVLRICSLLMNQSTLFMKLCRQYEDQRANDLYTMATICLNDDVRKGMGEVNSRICQDLEERVFLNPKVAAMKEVLEQTYLCGSDSCSSYIKDSFTFVFADWKIGVVVSVVTVLVVNCTGCALPYLNSNRRRRRRDNAEAVGIPSLPYSHQYYYNAVGGNHGATAYLHPDTG